MKDLDIKNLVEPLKLLSQWIAGGESWIPTCTNNYVPLCASMGQHCSLPTVQRKTAFVEQSWWPERISFGSMRWCSFPWHKLLPRPAQKKCCINLIHKFTSVFSRNVIYAGLLGKAFPRKQAFVDIRVFLWFRKQRPRFAQGQPKGYFQFKELHRTAKAYCSNECWLKGVWRPSMLSSMCQHMARLQFDSCAEKDSLCGTVMMAWTQDVWINAFGVRFHGKSSWVFNPCLKPTWFPTKIGKDRHWTSVFFCGCAKFAQGQPKGHFFERTSYNN